METKALIPISKRGRTHPLKTKRGSLNFEVFAAEGNHFINCVAKEMGVPRNRAARITKAVLHAVRDKLPPDDSVQFAQGLPMAMKGVYFDQYDISKTPVKIRQAHDFLDYIFYKDEFSAQVDFPRADSAYKALRSVFRVLYDFMDEGQVDQIKKLLGKEIEKMINGSPRYLTDAPLKLF